MTNNKNSNYLITILLSLLLFASCGRRAEEELIKINDENFSSYKYTSSTFRFSMVQEVKADIPIKWNNRLLRSRLVIIYLDHPKKGGKILVKQLTDKHGYLQVHIKIPKNNKSYYIYYQYLGNEYIEEVPIKKQKTTTFMSIINLLFPSAHALEPCVQSFSPWTNSYNFLATSYDNNGVPDNIIRGEDNLSQEFLDRVDISLPERKPVPQYHPDFIEQGIFSNIHLTENAQLWITYLAEGAGYKNTLGYFSYQTGSPPQSTSEIEQLNIIFPNVSNQDSGGGLLPGDKVYLGQFEAGTSIAYFLTANGWNSSSKCIRYYNQSWNYTVYSIPELNPELSTEYQKHNVLFYDEDEEKVVIGFEDLNREAGSDDDFNDAIFYITANPVTAINTDSIAPIDSSVDNDNDGINNEFDDYPDDETKAFNNYYPGQNKYGTLLFEDLWPYLGDYDFNDLVVFYNYTYITNASSEVVQIIANFRVTATGAGQSNGFALTLPISPDKISSITGQEIFENDLSLANNGTEENQSHTVIIVTDNVNGIFPKFSNVYSSRNTSEHNINIVINFSQSVNIAILGLPPYDPFLIKDQDRQHEIHQINYGPTSLGNSQLLGKQDDTSNKNQGIYYRTVNYLPWVLNIPEEIPHPKESIPIYNAFNNFAIWASSEGMYYSNWYKSEEDNINDNKVIQLSD